MTNIGYTPGEPVAAIATPLVPSAIGIVRTSGTGCREAVDEGVNGFLVKERDSADLIEKIEKFLSLSREERKQMGLAGRSKVEREFDRNIVVRKYLEEIESIWAEKA